MASSIYKPYFGKLAEVCDQLAKEKSMQMTPRPIKRFNGAIKRRNFMLGAFASMGLWATHLLPMPTFRSRSSLADLNFSDFNALLGEHFYLYNQAGLSDIIQLVNIKDHSFQTAGPSSARQACFSLAFRAPQGHGFTQDTYTFAHPKLGYFDLFIVPTQTVEHEDRYIAVINRI